MSSYFTWRGFLRVNSKPLTKIATPKKRKKWPLATLTSSTNPKDIPNCGLKTCDSLLLTKLYLYSPLKKKKVFFTCQKILLYNSNLTLNTFDLLLLLLLVSKKVNLLPTSSHVGPCKKKKKKKKKASIKWCKGLVFTAM